MFLLGKLRFETTILLRFRSLSSLAANSISFSGCGLLSNNYLRVPEKDGEEDDCSYVAGCCFCSGSVIEDGF